MKSCLKRKSFFVVSFCMAVLCLTAELAKCKTIAVRADGTGDYPTIQQTIDTAVNGDEIIVSRGRYVENISLGGKDIILRSSDPMDPCVVAGTIIDGNQAGSVVTFDGTESPDCVLSGFTITNGSGMGSESRFAGGIYGGQAGQYEQGSLATIRNNIITGNLVESEGRFRSALGGGLYRCDGLIENNVISLNVTKGHQSYGAGLYRCYGTIRDNVITGNSAVPVDSSSGNGGGLFWCSGTIENNIISSNTASNGGGLFACSGTVQNNIICKNYASSDGGGMWQCHGIIRSNLISGNSTEGWGGGIYYSYGARIENDTICGNSGSYGGGLSRCIYTDIRNCIIWANKCSREGAQIFLSEPISYSCIEGWTAVELGNIISRPLFVEAGNWGPNDVWSDGDYHLLWNSPCVNAGDPAYPDDANEADLDGMPRIINGRIDMGAYEFYVNSAPVACVVGGNRFFEAGDDCEALVVLDGSCSSDADSTAGTNDDINDFDWYEVIDACDPNSDIYIGSGEVIECNLPLGEHDIVLEVTDKACAFDVNEATITVEDTTPPVLMCPEDVAVSDGFGGAEVTYDPTATDECDANPAVTTDIASGSFFETGVTTVTATATDASGNSSTCTFDVIVSCFGVNHVKLETKAGKKGNKVELKGTFNPGVPIDLMIDDVMYTIDDGQGHVFSFLIPAGSFELEGKGDKDKYKFHSPKGSQQDIKARFDFLKCKFELKVKGVMDTSEITADTLAIVLQAGANLVEEVVQVQAKPKHLEFKREPKLSCCQM